MVYKNLNSQFVNSSTERNITIPKEIKLITVKSRWAKHKHTIAIN